MKRTLLLTAIVSVFVLFSSTVKAQDVINLGINDDIKTTLAAYSGTNVVLVIPQGYTNPQSVPTYSGTPPVAAYSSVDLSTLTNLTANTKITFQGDGSNPTLSFKVISMPPALSKLAFKGLKLIGASPDPTVNYIINQGAAAPLVLDSLVFDNCTISTFRSLLRFQSTTTPFTQKANSIIINNCIASGFADYGVLYNNKAGAYMGAVKVSKSTFYGFGQYVFELNTNTGSLNISDCTFDNVVSTAAKYLIDLNAQNVPATLTNCILGQTSIAGAYTFRSGGTLSIVNSYYTSDWTASTPTATGGITGSLIAYSGASTDLFTTPAIVSGTVASSSFTTTIGNYKIKDASFAGANSAGDPRWYLNAVSAVKQVLSDKGVSFNGTEILNNKGLAIEVYSVLGKKVAVSKASIPTANFQKGVYIVRISGSNDSLKICI